jgi:zinc/manganese transport system permease protein
LFGERSLTGYAVAHAFLQGTTGGYLVAGVNLGAMTVGGVVAALIVAVPTRAVARFTSLREDASLAAF